MTKKTSPNPTEHAKQIAASAGTREVSDPRGADESCGEFDIRIGRDGTWYYDGSPIGRKPLVKLFASVLRREDDGEYWLVTPVERGRIEVEDVPFVAVELSVDGTGEDQALNLRTNLDDIVTVDAQHPLRVVHDPKSGAPTPYVLVRDGLEARISRAVYYELVELGVGRETDGDHVHGVWSKGHFFALGTLMEPV